jgi:hypothetical protein
VPVPPESVEVGKCYVTEGSEERHVIEAAHGKVTYLVGRQRALWDLLPRRRVMTRKTFAAQAVREVPCSHPIDFQPGEKS